MEWFCNGDLIIPPRNTKKIGDKKYTWWKSLWSSGHSKKRIKLEAWWPAYLRDVEEYIKRCKKCKELKHFVQTTLHQWPRKVGPWSCVHMDHAYISGVGLLLIQGDSFSGWPEVIRVPEKKSSMIKQILRVIFSRNGIPKALVSDNAPEFCNEDLNLS